MYSKLVNFRNEVEAEIDAKINCKVSVSELSHITTVNLIKLREALDNAIRDLT